jgi:serine/threonine protein kinase/tetratricopeptide (TPR) repeat protein
MLPSQAVEALRERFGKYHVLEKIAQGGMAEVYKVKTVGIAGFEKVQALKRILPHSAREGRFIRSFIDEARIAVELTHRNIVQVFDFGKADGELYMAMELIEGRDLRTAMGQAVVHDVALPTPIAAYIISEVAAGLDYAHRKTDGYGGALGIVHCDVSPSNVMLSSDGYVKILDFGIARATFASALERRRLRGKPRYMAPEQTIGEPPTAAADVFALGIIAWELFTGLPLYRGSDVKSILEAVRRTQPPRIDRMNPQVPTEIVDAVATALSREPPARGTAADLAAACARTAMLGGARALAAWLGELDTRVASSPAVAERTPASVSVQRATPANASHAASTPPLRPSTRSLTGSLAHVPPAPTDLGAGTPGFPHDAPSERTTSPAASAYDGATPPRRLPTEPMEDPYVARERLPTEPAQTTPATHPFERAITTGTSQRALERASTTGLVYHAFGDRDPTATSTSTSTVSATASAASPWDVEHTAPGVGKLADALDTAARAALGRTGETLDVAGEIFDPARPARQVYERFVPVPGTDPAALRFDDEVTHHGLGSPAVGETSFDDLEVEPDDAPLAPGTVDEPIDDDLGALATASAAERRRTVIVAAQLEGAEVETLRPIARALGELAYQRGGVVLDLRDDALLVAFGLEIAGEDDVAIAMGWAIDAAAMTRDAAGTRASAPELGAITGPLPEVSGPILRVGARTGVATGVTGARTAGEALATGSTIDGATRIPGDAIEEARALSRDAAPDRPLFVGAAGRVTSELYTLREVPAPRRIAGRGRITEVVGPRSFDERDRARLERRGKFVGRTAQLAELETWFQRAIAADRRLSALIAGAAGTGKSRLVAELIARRTAAGVPMRVVLTAANPASHHAPFALVIDLYQAALGLPPQRGRHARSQLVQRLLHLMREAGAPEGRARAVATDLDRAMELRDGVGLGAPEVADLRPRLSAGLTAFRAAMTDRERPLLTVIEDIHLADSPSLEVLRHALAVSAPGPELLVLTTRPEGPPPPAVDVVIGVGDLVGADLRALIADRLGDQATPIHIAAVLARGGGNPLFVEELAQAVREAGDDVPASARDVISARLDRLSPAAKVAVRLSAVLGETVRARLLEELLGEASLEPVLYELVEAGILARAPSVAHSTEGALRFARGLVREVVYESLSARALRDAHARVGRLLAARLFAGREEPPAIIAEHLERGGETAAAAAFWLRAGKLALAASDFDTAVAHFTRALALEHELGPTPVSATSRARRRQALAGREEAHRLAGDVVSDPGDLDALQRLCEGDARRLADVAIRRAQRLLRVGDYAGAMVATVVAEDHALAAAANRARGEALRVRGEILERLGRFDEALEVVGDARELFAREGAVADEMAAMVGRGRIYLMRAQYETAREAYRPVIARIEKTGDPWLERVVQNHVAIIEMCLGNYELAMASAQRSLELCRRYGDRAREGDALSVAGIILLEVGLYEAAAARFGEALELLSRTGSRWSRADCLIYAGACAVRRGEGAGMAMLDDALGEARRLGARYLEANALITRAGAHLVRGELAPAIADAREGAAVAHAATLVGYELQGLARHAVALVRQAAGGHLAEAGGLVHRALGLLDHQRYLEGSEEEVYALCAEVLRAAGADDRARSVLGQGRAEVERKLAALTDPAWRAAYVALAAQRGLR